MPARIDESTVKQIIELKNSGKSINEISHILNIYRGSIRLYLKGGYATPPPTKSVSSLAELNKNQIIAYSYLLGVYLGDGHIDKMPRTYRLRVSCSTAHQDVIKNQRIALKCLFPNNKISTVYPKNVDGSFVNCIVLQLYNSNLPNLFLQYGIGNKHDRDVSLKVEQLNLLDKHLCLAGLVDTDGSVFKYSTDKNGIEFSNKSVDIINLYCSLLEEFNISYRRRQKTRNGIGEGIEVVAVRRQEDANKFILLLEDAYARLSVLR